MFLFYSPTYVHEVYLCLSIIFLTIINFLLLLLLLWGWVEIGEYSAYLIGVFTHLVVLPWDQFIMESGVSGNWTMNYQIQGEKHLLGIRLTGALSLDIGIVSSSCPEAYFMKFLQGRTDFQDACLSLTLPLYSEGGLF